MSTLSRKGVDNHVMGNCKCNLYRQRNRVSNTEMHVCRNDAFVVNGMNATHAPLLLAALCGNIDNSANAATLITPAKIITCDLCNAWGELCGCTHIDKHAARKSSWIKTRNTSVTWRCFRRAVLEMRRACMPTCHSCRVRPQQTSRLPQPELF